MKRDIGFLQGFFEAPQLEQQRTQAGKAYLEFLRVSSMSAGIYVLPAGSSDLQRPHKQDEMYYVISGKARMRVGSEDQFVKEGGIIFVAAKVEHHFHDIEEDLTVLVFFAPAETEL
ncbi:MAG TPA: cupin domain-containing protein [Terriglobales bacterium]|nr:cupin domain-containing protein [Terriglobales bacterium]